MVWYGVRLCVYACVFVCLMYVSYVSLSVCACMFMFGL